ncbi:PTS sugar transporter subunit IIA [Sebaldella sp. S0638]|uniref:PTS sugar transporter subunit IIA n=1 Tax=Sebaldella sp. S0638 TaxID=2957809 RepID=UPI00209CBE07|nr:PTS sugar transporter subunit IIA [Sebaldella sp. S0638]MCP1223574.1 PTS sugar transporter subunit IIA [Sebaldella sp. S0638]
MLTDYIKKEWIKLNVKAENWEEAIEKGGRELLEAGIITQSYIEAMKKAVKDMGAYFVVTKNVALPHAKAEEGILETGFGLITLKNPVEFGNVDNDPVKYIFCLAIKSSNEHIEILKELSELLEDKEFFRLLDSEKDGEKIYDYLKNKKI